MANKLIISSIIALTTVASIQGCGAIYNDNYVDFSLEPEIGEVDTEDNDVSEADIANVLKQFDSMFIYYNGIVSFSAGKNEYTELIEAEEDSISLIFDLDNDGVNEAIVCNIDAECSISELPEYSEDYVKAPVNQKVYKIKQAYFITENNDVEFIDIIEGEYIMQYQCLVSRADCSYLCLNGYYDAAPYGSIITTENDEPVSITEDMFHEGHKYFYTEDTIVWHKSQIGCDMTYVVRESYNDTLAKGGGTGLFSIPYYYKFDGTRPEAYGARKLTEEEVLEMGSFDTESYADADSVEYILFDNGLLYVNSVIGNLQVAYFKCKVYELNQSSRNRWDVVDIRMGFAVENPLEPSTWEYMTRIHL